MRRPVMPDPATRSESMADHHGAVCMTTSGRDLRGTMQRGWDYRDRWCMTKSGGPVGSADW